MLIVTLGDDGEKIIALDGLKIVLKIVTVGDDGEKIIALDGLKIVIVGDDGTDKT